MGGCFRLFRTYGACPLPKTMRRIGEAQSPVGSALIDQAKRDQGFDSPMLHHRTKCRTRMHWQPVRTSDKLKGQLMRLSFKFTRDYAHEFDILTETGTENFDRSLRDGLDLELYQPVYEMPFFDQ